MNNKNSHEAKEPSEKDIYEHLKDEVSREEGLINNRLTWTLTFNGFLFASIALIGDEKIQPNLRNVLQYSIPIVGLIVAFLGMLGVIAAYIAIWQHRVVWEGKLSNYPKPGGKPPASWFGKAASISIPLVLLAAWAYIFYRLTNAT